MACGEPVPTLPAPDEREKPDLADFQRQIDRMLDPPAHRSDLTALDDRLRHLERIAALRHSDLYGDPEGTARQLAGQGGLSEPVAVEADAPKVAGQEYDD